MCSNQIAVFCHVTSLNGLMPDICLPGALDSCMLCHSPLSPPPSPLPLSEARLNLTKNNDEAVARCLFYFNIQTFN